MKHILTLNEYNTSSNFYILFNELVYVDNISRFGDEIKVDYTKEDGTRETYIGDDTDFKEDFIESNDSFVVKSKKIPKVNIQKDIVKKKLKYNVVFYIGTKNIETIKKGIENKNLAYALKNTLNKDPKYKMGRIEVESYETI